MRKVAITAGIGIVIAFFLGTPYFFGQTNQALNDELLARANHLLQNKGEQVPASEQETVASFVIDETIYHGPFYWGHDANGHAHLGFGRGYFVSVAKPDDKTRAWLKDQGLQSSSVDGWANRTAEVSLLGRIRATSYLAPLTYQNGDTHLNWQGANGKIMLSPGLSNLKGSAVIGALSYNEDHVKLAVPSAKVNLKLRYKDGLWVGSSALNVPQMTTQRDNKAEMTISNLLLQGDSNVSGDLLNTTFTLGVDNLQVGRVNYGPLSYNLDIKNVDANAWLKLRDLAAQYDALMDPSALQYSITMTHYHRGWFCSSGQMILSINRAKPTGLIKRQLHNLAKQPELVLLGNEITKTLPTIVNKGAQFDLQPTPAHTQPQMLQISASVTFPKILSAQDIGQLIEKAESHVKVAFLADLIKTAMAHQYPEKNSDAINVMTQALLNKWTASGYLSQNQQQYVFALDYSQGKLSVNGKTMADAAATVSSDVPNMVVPAAPAVIGHPAVSSAAPTAVVKATTAAPAPTTHTLPAAPPTR